MLTVERLGKTRGDHAVEGKSIKAIVRGRGVSRNVRKALRREQTQFSYEHTWVNRPICSIAVSERVEISSGRRRTWLEACVRRLGRVASTWSLKVLICKFFRSDLASPTMPGKDFKYFPCSPSASKRQIEVVS